MRICFQTERRRVSWKWNVKKNVKSSQAREFVHINSIRKTFEVYKKIAWRASSFGLFREPEQIMFEMLMDEHKYLDDVLVYVFNELSSHVLFELLRALRK